MFMQMLWEGVWFWECCSIILQTTDFTSFAKLHSDVHTNNCSVMFARWKEEEQGYLFEIQADRFLRNMVRSLTGTLLDVGQGKLSVQEFQDIVNAKDRSKHGEESRPLFVGEKSMNIGLNSDAEAIVGRRVVGLQLLRNARQFHWGLLLAHSVV